MPLNDRRNGHRYVPARGRIRLGWWQGQLFRTISARLRNLSLSGALVELEIGDANSFETKTWLCLVDQADAHWVQAEVVEVLHEVPDTSAQLRLKFLDPVPFDAFKTAVWDPKPSQLESASTTVPPREPSDREEDRLNTENALRYNDKVALRSLLRVQHSAASPRDQGLDAGDLALPHPPTLLDACRRQIASSRKTLSFPWLVVLVLSLVISVLVAIFARRHMISLGRVGSVMGWIELAWSAHLYFS